MDKLSPKQRSSNMAAVLGENTSPELRVRRILHAMGYRFRLHRKDLPGKPDIVLPRHRLCIFVHGCFWHQHPGCKRATIPETRRAFWEEKFRQNKIRDDLVRNELENLGWHVCTIWECELKSSDHLTKVISRCFNMR